MVSKGCVKRGYGKWHWLGMGQHTLIGKERAKFDLAKLSNSSFVAIVL